MIVDAAKVDCAYTDGAYVELPFRISENEVPEGLALCRMKGTLAFRIICADPEKLRLDSESKCPDRFSRKEV